MRGKKAYYPDITGWFYQVLSTTERTESSREQEPVPSTSGVSEITACPLHPIADGPSALPSSIVSPSCSQEPLQLYHLPLSLSCLFTHCQPLYASCWTVPLYFSRYCTLRLKMFSLCLLSLYYFCEKHYYTTAVYSHCSKSLQESCLENSMHRETWQWVVVLGITKSHSQLSH